jgi:hypothetical protein
MSDLQLLSEYDRLKKEMIESGRDTAKKYIPFLCNALQKDDPNLSRFDIRDRIKKDLVDVWFRSTIYENLPDEYKDQLRSS